MNSIEADDLPVGWSRTILGAAVDVLDHLRVPVNAEERSKRVGSVPYYGATGQVGWIDDHIFDDELVLLGEDGAPFLDPAKPKAYVISGKSWVNNHAHVLRAKLGLGNRFLLYQLNQADFRPFVSGTTRLKLPQAPMRRMPIVIAPEAEQKRIVAEIEKQVTRLDAAVGALKRVQANLKRYRASVLKAACEGRLVPTEAELARAEGRDYETGAQLLARILKERRAKWEADQLVKMHAAGRPPSDDKWKAKYPEPAGPTASRLPELPEGWIWGTMEQLSASVTYGTSSKSDEDASGVPVLRMGNIVEGQLSFESLKFLPLTHSEFPELLLLPGDILFNRTNSAELVGKTAVYRGNPSLCSFASYLIRVRLVGWYEPDLIAYYLNSPNGRSWIASVVNQQVGQANVNGSKLQSLMVPIPPLNEQRRIVAEGERRLSVIEDLSSTMEVGLKREERLLQSILKRAFEGKLVPQDPNDEPASALLERIRAERLSTQQAADSTRAARSQATRKKRT